MPDQSAPFVDHAAPILAGDPRLDDAARADLWDAFHSKSSDELVQHLQPLAIPDDTKDKLIRAKQMSMPAPAPIDKATGAINRLAQLDPAALDLAESHPNVLKVLAAAATAVEKAPTEASGASKSASKGSTAGKAGQAQGTPLPPRPDGTPHLPSIPEGHRRILASDGGIHDIPEENIQKSFELDPKLHVLNP